MAVIAHSMEPPPAGIRRLRWMPNATSQGGFTLVEMMVTIAVAAILIAMAVPSFSGIAERNRLRNVAEKLRSDLKLAHSEALRRDLPVFLTFKNVSGGATWCYGLSQGAPCDCAAGACELDPGASTNVSNAAYRGVTMPDLPYAGTAGALTFSPARPTLSADSAAFFSPSGKEARVVIASNGRVRLCSPAGSNKLLYFNAC